MGGWLRQGKTRTRKYIASIKVCRFRAYDANLEIENCRGTMKYPSMNLRFYYLKKSPYMVANVSESIIYPFTMDVGWKIIFVIYLSIFLSAKNLLFLDDLRKETIFFNI